jgi:hypothetical protein
MNKQIVVYLYYGKLLIRKRELLIYTVLRMNSKIVWNEKATKWLQSTLFYLYIILENPNNSVRETIYDSQSMEWRELWITKRAKETWGEYGMFFVYILNMV